MFHFSADRLAGLDTAVLRIATPRKVPTLIPTHSADATRPPLAALDNVHVRCPQAPLPCVPCPPDVLFFRPLPPLPSASALQLPSFLDLSTQPGASPADQVPRRSAVSLPPPALFRVSSSLVASSRRVAARNTKNNKVFEGPQWIPAFHHPNSPYVPWSSPIRRRILPQPSPVCPSSPCIRSGAIAPEPWVSSTFSQTHKASRRERFSSSWKSFKNSVKRRAKTVASHVGKSTRSLKMPCTGQSVLCNYDDTDAAAVLRPNLTSRHIQSAFAKTHCGAPRDSLSSFASSDSRTLTAWLAERRANASCVVDGTPREMSVEEYELMGSWLDLRSCDAGWVCGVKDCDLHTTGGSPCAASEYPDGLRMAMPFDSADLLAAKHPSSRAPTLPFPPGPFYDALQYHSLPRLPCQSFSVHSAQDARPATLKNPDLNKRRELSMPGGWTFS